MIKSLSGCWWSRLLLAIVLTGTLAGSATSSLFQSEDRIHISSLHQIDDDYYAVTENFRLDGVVDGDLILFSYSSNIGGTVTRSATIIGRNIDHSGMIEGSLRAAGEKIDIGGSVLGSVVAAGALIRIKPGAIITRDLNAYAAEVEVAGSIGGNLIVKGDRIAITGTISGDVDLEGNRIDIVPPAIIEGNLTYKSRKEARIETDGVTILGDVQWEEIDEDADGAGSISPAIRIAWALAGFLFGAVIIRLFRRQTEATISQLRTRPSVAIAAGMLGFLIVAALMILVMISAAGVVGGQAMIATNPVALGSILLAFSTFFLALASLGAIIGGSIFCSGSLVVGLFLGLTGLKFVRPDIKAHSVAALFVGVAAMALLFAIPYLGPILALITSLFGGGAIILGVRAGRSPFDKPKAPEVQ